MQDEQEKVDEPLITKDCVLGSNSYGYGYAEMRVAFSCIGWDQGIHERNGGPPPQ